MTHILSATPLTLLNSYNSTSLILYNTDTLTEHFSSLQEEVEVKTKKLKKLWAKFQGAVREAQDLQEEFQVRTLFKISIPLLELYMHVRISYKFKYFKATPLIR